MTIRFFFDENIDFTTIPDTESCACHSLDFIMINVNKWMRDNSAQHFIPMTKITILWNGYPGVKDSARTWDWTQVCTGQGLNPEPVSSQGHQCHQYIILLMKSKFLCLSFFCFNWNLRKIESKQWIYVDEVFDNLLSFNVHLWIKPHSHNELLQVTLSLHKNLKFCMVSDWSGNLQTF